MEQINFFCINLDSRIDRWIDCQKQFAEQWIKKVERWSAKPLPENRRFGAWLSHREIIEYAKTRNWEYVWVFEDDINFIGKDFLTQTQKALDTLSEREWYILYFGGSMGRYGQLYREKWLKSVLRVKKIFEAHAVIYHRRFFDIYLKKHPPLYSLKIDEYYIDNKYKAFDEWFANVVQYKYPCYITNKIYVAQKDDFSSIENKFVYRNKISIYRFYAFKYCGSNIASFLDIFLSNVKKIVFYKAQ